MSVKPISNGKWLIDIRMGRRDRFRQTFQGTKEEAVIFERELRKRVGKESANQETVSGIIEPYLEYVRLHQSPKTYRDKKRILLSHIHLFFGSMHPEFITPQLMESYKRKRLLEARRKIHREINLELMAFSAMVKWAKRQGLCSEELAKINALPYKRPLPKPLTRDEVFRLIENASPYYRALFLCLYHAGMRQNEAITLSWSRVNFEGNYILAYGKGNKERIIPMTALLTKALRDR